MSYLPSLFMIEMSAGTMSAFVMDSMLPYLFDFFLLVLPFMLIRCADIVRPLLMVDSHVPMEPFLFPG